uniref:Uncharacterized protein n=1 Tax=Helianthus annuus TaxID=4232 RepID=A0A251UQW1_HELAN
MGPCGFTFIVILAQNSKNPLFDCCKLPILSFHTLPSFNHHLPQKNLTSKLAHIIFPKI